MTLDQALQKTIFHSSEKEIEKIVINYQRYPKSIIKSYQVLNKWTFQESKEFLDNVNMAYELIVKKVGT